MNDEIPAALDAAITRAVKLAWGEAFEEIDIAEAITAGVARALDLSAESIYDAIRDGVSLPIFREEVYDAIKNGVKCD